MTLRQSFGGLTFSTSRNAASGSKANPSGLSAQAGKWRLVPSPSRNGFQSFGGVAVLGMLLIHPLVFPERQEAFGAKRIMAIQPDLRLECGSKLLESHV